MELNLSENMKQMISAFLLLILPLIAIALGMVFNILNAWYFILVITWFGLGVIFFGALN